MKSREIAVVLVLIGFILLSSSFAQASCTVSGKVVTVAVNYTSGWVTVYIAPFTTTIASVYYYGYIPNNSSYGAYPYDQLINLYQNALGSGVSAFAVGNTSSCPTSGTSRYIGVITQGYAAKGY